LKGAFVPLKNRVRFPTRCAIAAALSIAFAVPGAHAAGLGRLSVQSALGQPLRAEIDVNAVSEDEASTLAVALASQAAFRKANLDFNPALSSLRFEVGKRSDGSYVIRVQSSRPVEEPFLDLLIELTSSSGWVQREYTVLLDPPALRQPADVLPPVAARAPAAAPPLPAPVVTAPTRASTPSTAASRPAAAPADAASAPAAKSYKVKPGDTLGKIAAETKPASANLDQMLVALFQANPEAFVGNNMNRLLVGRTLSIPSASTVDGIGASTARSEVAAQSADFARYRSRLAQAAAGGSAVTAATPPAAVGQGRVGTKVEDRSAPPAGGDQLKIAKADAPASAAAAKKAAEDEAAARKRALVEQEERAADLKRTNEALKKAVELQNKAAADAQKQAAAAAAALAKKQAEEAAALSKKQAEEAAAKKKAEEEAAAKKKADEAVEAARKQAEEAAALAMKQAEVAAAKKALEEKAAAPVAAPEPAPAPASEKAPPPAVAKAAPPAKPEPSLLDMLTSPYALAGIVAALLALLVGLNVYRKRKVEASDEFQNSGIGASANSLFGGVGGQSVDTGATSTFNSSFIPASSQLDSNEVDPVAEADVYIAYGREAQAEDILKEALRLQPDRHAVRVKLMEMYSRRDDKPAFMAAAEELKQRTGGAGEDWIRAMRLGYALDPSNPMFAGAAEMSAGNTDVRLPTLGGRPSTFGGTGATLGGVGAALANSVQAGPATVPHAKSPPTRPATAPMLARPDTVLSPDTMLQGASPSTLAAPTTTFETALMQPAPDAIQQPATSLDFSSLDFDLSNPTTRQLDVTTRQLDGPRNVRPEPAPTTAAPSVMPTVGGFGSIPDVDLSLPTRAPVPPTPAPTFLAPAPVEPVHSAVLGDIGTVTDDASTLSSPSTDLATVPLVDFVLTDADGGPSGRRAETQAGSPLAAQMETKLDLARGYIDLGVKDGARELLEEVMREGTREQRQGAVDLMKQVEG